MEPMDESFEAENPEVGGEGLPGWDRVPDFAERQETLRRANEALERARMLLKRVNHLENTRVKNPAME
jgi:hypothetical protein